ncbi:MAG: transcriptional repressor [Alphaproteobacteria bacterium]|nr:MAG: transcriptional repressor [Alphaproteobacteria bacterium]
MPDKDKKRRYSQALQKLRQVGLRPTCQRLALAKVLFEGPNRHVTAESLHGETTGANINISLATIYNSLHQFTNAGLLREVVLGSGRTYFDTNISDHHHYFMEKEGCLEDIPDGVVNIDKLPNAPRGKKFSRIEVIIHVVEDI